MTTQTIQCPCGNEIPTPELLPGMISILPWQYQCGDCLCDETERVNATRESLETTA